MSTLNPRSIALAAALSAAAAGGAAAGETCRDHVIDTWQAKSSMSGKTGPIRSNKGYITVDPSGTAIFQRKNSDHNRGYSALGNLSSRNDDPRVEGGDSFTVKFNVAGTNYSKANLDVRYVFTDADKNEIVAFDRTGTRFTPNREGNDVINRDMPRDHSVKLWPGGHGGAFNLHKIELYEERCHESGGDNDRGNGHTGTVSDDPDPDTPSVGL